jgi:hypothetical protein
MFRRRLGPAYHLGPFGRRCIGKSRCDDMSCQPFQLVLAYAAYGCHAFIPGVQHLFSDVASTRLVPGGFDYLATCFERRLAQLFQHTLVVCRRYSQARLEEVFQRFSRRPCLAAFYGKPGRIGRIARIGLGCNDVVHGCVAHIAPLRIVERNVLRVAVGIAYDVVGQDVPSELLELCAYDPGRYVCARRAPITCAITRRLT